MAKHSSTFTGSETAANLNSGNAKTVTVKAQWKAVQTVWDFPYKNSSQSWTAPQTGIYKLEVWGAQGGSVSGYNGGKGAYATGQIAIQSGTTLYAFIGQQGPSYMISNGEKGFRYGGYNGGGGVYVAGLCYNSGGGGGGTDFRKTDSSYIDDGSYRYTTTSSSISSRIIVAGGGGGALYDPQTGRAAHGGIAYNNTTSTYYLNGVVGGAENGCSTTNGTISSAGYHTSSSCQNEASGGLGYGASTGSCNWGGGGGGYYGGGSAGGGGGPGAGGSSWASGTINGKSFSNMIITSGNASMPSASGGTETGHSGNGYARITYLGTSI